MDEKNQRGGAGGTALTSSALASGTAVTLQEKCVPATQITAPAQQDWRLLLVKAWNLLPESYTVELVRLKNGLQVDKRIYDDLNAMLTDCRAAGLQPIVCSAYRTQATQTRLYNNKVSRLRAAGYSAEEARVEAARWVAPPGTSEHQTGLALDLVSLDYQLLDEKQEQTPEQQWLMAHSWEYGFVLRYPSDKSAITGIGYEPWHYRYVGKEAAKACMRAASAWRSMSARRRHPRKRRPAQTSLAVSPAGKGIGTENEKDTPKSGVSFFLRGESSTGVSGSWRKAAGELHGRVDGSDGAVCHSGGHLPHLLDPGCRRAA